MLYVRGADRHDRELILSTYWPDSTDDHGGYIGDGPGWADAALSWHDKIYSCNHHVTNVLSEVEGNRAKRESMFICVVPFKEPDVTAFQAGRYRDLCEKRDGVWKILRRTCVWDWMDVRPNQLGLGRLRRAEDVPLGSVVSRRSHLQELGGQPSHCLPPLIMSIRPTNPARPSLPPTDPETAQFPR